MKLPVFATIAETYSFLWRARRDLVLLAVPLVVLFSVFGALVNAEMWSGIGSPTNLQEYFDAARIQGKMEMPGWFVVVSLVFAAVSIVAIIMYATACHRLILLPDISVVIRDAYRWRWRHTQYLIGGLKIVLISIAALVAGVLLATVSVGVAGVIVAIVAGKGGTDGPRSPEVAQLLGAGTTLTSVAIFVGTFVALWWIVSRLMFVLPAVAAGQPARLRDAWRMSRRNGWRVFWVMTLVQIPFALLSTPVSVGIFFGLLALGLGASLPAQLVANLALQMLTLGYYAILLTALSISYQRINAASGYMQGIEETFR